MTYKTVLRSLQDVFPQIDLRILKSIAIEYPKDADAAVEFVLSDVLPVINQPVVTSFTPDVFHDTEDLFDEGNSSYTLAAMSKFSLVEDNNKQYGYQSRKALKHETNADTNDKNSSHSENKSLSETPHGTSTSFAFKVSETVTSSGVTTDSQRFYYGLEDQHVNVQELCQLHYDSFQETLSGSVPYALSSLSLKPASLVEEGMSQIKNMSNYNEYGTQQSGTYKDVSNVKGCPAEGGIVLSSFISEKVSKECTPLDELSEKANEKVSTGYKYQVPNNLTQPDQIAELDFLERHIAQAESNKDMLTSEFDSVIKMLKEVELHEDLTKKAEEEVSFAGEDILKKVEDLRQIARNVEKTNDEKAREVNGEKFVLKTKAQEIHNQLLNISDKKDKCLSMIEEIGLILDARLSAAKTRETEAFQMKLEKEEMARKALDEQGAIVDCLLQESKRLEGEAEENAKLKKFLEVRSYMVDTLKGEIDFLFYHVTSLKGMVNGCAQLENSLVPLGASSLAASTSPSEENLSSEGVSQSVVNTNPVTILQDPLNYDLQDNAGSTNVVQSLENSIVTSAPIDLTISTSPVEKTALAKSVDHSVVSDYQTTFVKEYLDQNVQESAGSTNALDSPEKLNVSSGSCSLATSTSSDEETTLVGSPIAIVKAPTENNLQAEASVLSQPYSDDDWEIFDESELDITS